MQTLGWIGLGHMGTPMATNLLKAGYKVIVYNRSEDRTIPLVELGAKKANSPKEVVEQSDINFIMLSDANAIQSVLTQENGVLGAITQGKVVVDMSTISPQESSAFAKLVMEKGGEYIDAPVSGSVGAAIMSQLLILAGGPKETVNLCQPFFNVLGKETIYFGSTGMGTSAKLTINMLLGIMMQGFGEAIVFGEKLGLGKAQIIELISKSALNNGLFQAKKESYATEEFPSAFMLELMSKDLGLVKTAADQMSTKLPLAETANDTFYTARMNGKAKLDMAAVYLELKD